MRSWTFAKRTGFHFSDLHVHTEHFLGVVNSAVPNAVPRRDTYMSTTHTSSSSHHTIFGLNTSHRTVPLHSKLQAKLQKEGINRRTAFFLPSFRLQVSPDLLQRRRSRICIRQILSATVPLPPRRRAFSSCPAQATAAEGKGRSRAPSVRASYAVSCSVGWCPADTSKHRATQGIYTRGPRAPA